MLKWRGWEFYGGQKKGGGGGGGGLESGKQRGSPHGAVLLAGCRRCGDVLVGVLHGSVTPVSHSEHGARQSCPCPLVLPCPAPSLSVSC